MSTNSPAPFSSVTAAHISPAVNEAVAAAKNLPELVNNFQTADPALAQQIEGKPLILSKTVWGTILLPVITALVAKFGLGWDPNTILLVDGVVVSGCAIVFRQLTTSPIAGVLSKGATPLEQMFAKAKTS